MTKYIVVEKYRGFVTVDDLLNNRRNLVVYKEFSNHKEAKEFYNSIDYHDSDFLIVKNVDSEYFRLRHNENKVFRKLDN